MKEIYRNIIVKVIPFIFVACTPALLLIALFAFNTTTFLITGDALVLSALLCLKYKIVDWIDMITFYAMIAGAILLPILYLCVVLNLSKSSDYEYDPDEREKLFKS